MKSWLPPFAWCCKRARLASGLVLFAYVVGHFVNHMAGLISIEAMDRILRRLIWFWDGIVGTGLLYGAFTVHFGLALWSIYRRQSFRMSLGESGQILLGFAVPFLATQHLVDTRISGLVLDLSPRYHLVVLKLWVLHPLIGLTQMVLLCTVWLHACIGLNYWLKTKRWFHEARPLLFALALLIPTLAALGFVEAGRTLAQKAEDPEWLAVATATLRAPSPELMAELISIKHLIWISLAGLMALAIGARALRRMLQRRGGIVRVAYPNGRRFAVLPGTTILETSRLNGIPHASICGGRGRCSTCRIRVAGPGNAIPEPSLEEVRVLQRIGAAPNVRLACQLRPTGDVVVVPLLPPAATAREGFARPAFLQGSEREVAILFADIRGFTQLAEGRLPYDVVFLLNRYFHEMGRAVEAVGGRVDKFIGDGVMALFGIDSEPEEGCRAALAAARNMAERLDELNRLFGPDLDKPLRIGIGLHAGPVIVGEMGYGAAVGITAIGDAVNAASRLETMTKTYGCQLIVSEELAQQAAIDLGDFPLHEIEIRGRRAMMAIRLIPSAHDLPAIAMRRRAVQRAV